MTWEALINRWCTHNSFKMDLMFLRHRTSIIWLIRSGRGLGVIIAENKRLENWTSPGLIIDGDDHEEIEIH